MTAKVVHCNGYSLAEDPNIPPENLQRIDTEGTHRDWEYVCWGDPNIGAFGRIPMTLWLAHHVGADLIIWSTGSSRIIDGDYEATVFLKRALQSFAVLKRDFSDRFGDDWWSDEASYRNWVQSISTTEVTSQRTSDSLLEAKKIEKVWFKTGDFIFGKFGKSRTEGLTGRGYCVRTWNRCPIALPECDALRCRCRDMLRWWRNPGCKSR